MSRACQHHLKLAVLEVIKRKKEILFGSFQNQAVTKSKKEAGWRKVLIKAQAVGLAKDKHDWVYARDKLFGLWKCRTLAKLDNSKKTGPGGGKAAKLNDVDKAILDIMGTDSPVVNGFDQSEADWDRERTAQTEHDSQARLPKHTNGCAKRSLRCKSADEYGMNRLKMELLRVEIHKNKLEIFKLENELGLPRSKYTKSIETTSNEQSVSSCESADTEFCSQLK